MRNWQKELIDRTSFLKERLAEAKADGFIFGNSGGKDSALVGILASKSTPNVTGVIMPCMSKRNYAEDTVDAKALADKFGIATETVDLTESKRALLSALQCNGQLKDMASANINPRLRMITLYALGQTKNYLVLGTGNASEGYMGYFTKWGDGAYDVNPIADLTVTEIYEFLRFLGCPQSIIDKAPSAALFEGQTDEKEMGVTYAEIDEFLFSGATNARAESIIKGYHLRTEHKRRMPVTYKTKD